jgi:membrane-bound serine protease (ClpP class)
MRRPYPSIVRRLGACAAMTLGLVLMAAGPGMATRATAAAATDAGSIRVVQVQGLLDAPNASLIRSAIGRANDDNATLLVVQIDSNGALDIDVESIIDDIDGSEVPIVVWVGPSGANASGLASLIAEAAHVVSVSQGSHIGAAHPARLDRPGVLDEAELADRLGALARDRGRDVDGARALASTRMSATDAEDAGAIDRVDPIVGELIVDLDGETVVTAAGEVTLSTARVVGEGVDRRREPDHEVVFERLGLRDQVLHALISPSIAYLLFVAGLALIVFEFFTASVGIAGATGAGSLIGAAIGFGHLPMRWWAVALVVVSMVAFGIDAQASAGAGGWTVIGVLTLIVGSLMLYGGSPRLGPPWWVHLVVVVGATLFMTAALSTMIRARFSTPTVGREGLIGAMGTAETDIDPEGVVVIKGSRWRARTNRATPISAGNQARVAAIEGTVLAVEPEEGAARDYRERRRRGDRAPGD